MMRRLLSLVFLFAVACSRETPAPPPAPAPTAPTATSAPAPTPAAPTPAAPAPAPVPSTTAPPAATAAPQEPVDRGAFVVIRDGKTLYREQFARNSRRIESDIAASGNNERVLQATELHPDGTVRNTVVQVVAGERSQSMAIVIRGTQAAVKVIDQKGQEATKAVQVPPGTIPNPVPESLAMLEQVIRRAKVLGGQKVEVPILPGTLRPQRVFVTFVSADTVRIESASATIDAKIDAQGRLLSASEPSQKITIRRE